MFMEGKNPVFIFLTIKAGPWLTVNKQMPCASTFIELATTTPPLEVLLANAL